MVISITVLSKSGSTHKICLTRKYSFTSLTTQNELSIIGEGGSGTGEFPMSQEFEMILNRDHNSGQILNVEIITLICMPQFHF